MCAAESWLCSAAGRLGGLGAGLGAPSGDPRAGRSPIVAAAGHMTVGCCGRCGGFFLCFSLGFRCWWLQRHGDRRRSRYTISFARHQHAGWPDPDPDCTCPVGAAHRPVRGQDGAHGRPDTGRQSGKWWAGCARVPAAHAGKFAMRFCLLCFCCGVRCFCCCDVCSKNLGSSRASSSGCKWLAP